MIISKEISICVKKVVTERDDRKHNTGYGLDIFVRLQARSAKNKKEKIKRQSLERLPKIVISLFRDCENVNRA